jgi:hypothetical protein
MRPPVAVGLRWCVSGVQGALRGRLSVAACRGGSFCCGPAADRTPALQQDGDTSLHKASSSGHAAVVQTLLQHGADIAATNKVGAAGVPLALAWRCARECLHAMCVRTIECMEMYARNRASLCGCAGKACEVERGMEMGRTCMHALATHPLTPLPASVGQNRSGLGRERRGQDSAARARGQAFALLCG